MPMPSLNANANGRPLMPTLIVMPMPSLKTDAMMPMAALPDADALPDVDAISDGMPALDANL